MANDMDAFVKLLSYVKCLKGFGVEDVRNLLSISSRVVWQPGEHIFLEGDQGRDVFIICSGKVNIWRKKGAEKVTLANLTEGDSFGEMGLIRGGARSASATAVDPSVALRINHEELHTVPSIAAVLYKNLARELAGKLQTANDIIVFSPRAGSR